MWGSVALTCYYFFLPYTHLVVDKAVLLHAVAVLDELGAHLLQEVVVDQRLWRGRTLARVDHFLCHCLLLLQRREPAGVELIPQL